MSSVNSDQSIIESSICEMEAPRGGPFVGISTLFDEEDTACSENNDHSIKSNEELSDVKADDKTGDHSPVPESCESSKNDSFRPTRKATKVARHLKKYRNRISDDSDSDGDSREPLASSTFTQNEVEIDDSDVSLNNDDVVVLEEKSENSFSPWRQIEADDETEDRSPGSEPSESPEDDSFCPTRKATAVATHFEKDRNESDSDRSSHEPLASSSLPQNEVENDDSVVCLDDDDDDDVVLNEQNENSVSPSRQIEVRMERRKLEIELNQINAEIIKMKESFDNLDLDSLPDGGEKMKVALKRKVQIRNVLNGRIKELDSQLTKFASGIKPKCLASQNSNFRDTPVDSVPPKHLNVDIEAMGRQALATYQTQQSVTVESLKKLQTSLERCPNESMVTEDPEGLRVKLLPHQNQALTWLLWRERQKPSGGILADDMGLGKTLTMLSLILKSKQTKNGKFRGDDDSSESDENDLPPSGLEGGTLVVCPASVMGQWEVEIKCKLKANLLTYCVHHGNKKERNPRRLMRFDVVLTTYTIVQKEKPQNGALFGVQWNRIILDESHVIRNHKSLTSQAIFDLKGKTRWCLTGTPVHNKALDFYAVVKFVKVEPFDDLALWKKWVDNKDSTGLHRLAVINKTLMLRRTKEDIQKKGGLKDMKEKKVETIMFQLDKEEFDLYEKVAHFSKTVLAQFIHQRAEKAHLFAYGVPVNRTKPHFAQASEENIFKNHPELEKLFKNLSSMKNIKTHHILVLLLRLRQICSHPCLAVNVLDKVELTGDGIDDEDGNDIDLLKDMQNMTLNPENSTAEDDETELTPSILSPKHPVFDKHRRSSKVRAILDIVTKIATTTDDKIVVVSQWTSLLQILEEVLNEMGTKCLNLNGAIPVPKRAPIIEEFNSKSLERKVLLLSLTSGGVGLNLIGGNHLLLVDLHWNPQLEAQAFDRVYRVGQLKPVHIYKFVSSDTIEERILKLQEHKLEIAKNVMTGSRSVSSNKLTIDEMKSLFSL